MVAIPKMASSTRTCAYTHTPLNPRGEAIATAIQGEEHRTSIDQAKIG